MLLVRSKADTALRYLFESRKSPVTAEELNESSFSSFRGKLVSSLSLSRAHPPIDEDSHLALRNIMGDCAHPELKAAYAESYDSFMRFLTACNMPGENYRIHSLRVSQ